MPVIIIYGIPVEVAGSGYFEDLYRDDVPQAVASVLELGLTPDQVTVIVPGDLVLNRSRGEVIVFIEGLFRKPERTKEVRQRMADAVRDVVGKFIEKRVPDCSFLEVIPRSQDPDDGFSEWKRE